MTRLILLLSDSAAVSIVVKATVIAALGLIGAWLGRRSRAAVRHSVLAACFAGLLGLPVASLLIPPVHLVVAQTPTVSSGFAEAIDTTFPTAPMKVNAPSVSRRSLPSVGDLLFAVWILGVVFFLLRLVVGLRQVYLLRRFGLPWREGQIVFHRRVDVLLHESLAVPVTCGVFRPAIVLPPDARNWDGENLNRAILHELEHVRRWDWVSQCAARVVCALYWFHPLVWIAWRQLTLEAERACDDAVLQRSEATAYADQLVELAQRLSKGGKLPGLAMASRSDLSSRVKAVLDSQQQRGRAGALLLMVACAVTAVAVLTISPLRMVATPQSTQAQPAANAPAFEVASVKLRDKPTPPFAQIHFGPDRLSLTEVNMSIALMLAYRVRGYQIQGPDWMKDGGGSSFFDVEAKASRPVSEDQLRLMLRTLLAERFHMKLHWDKKEMAVTALVVAKDGPKLHKSDPGIQVDSQFLGFNNVLQKPIRDTDGRISHEFSNAPMAALAVGLSAGIGAVDPEVIDMTGLPGRFDFVLRDMPRPAFGDPPTIDDKMAYYKKLLENEFGLTLEHRKAPVDVLVIDQTDKAPTAN